MKTQRTGKKRAVRWLSTLLLFGVIFTLTGAGSAWAIGTPSNTSIQNTASIDYSVATVPQLRVDSAPTSFLVDNVVRHLVTSAGDTNIVPDQDDAVLVFTLTNTGNTEQGYSLEVIDEAANNIETGNVRVYLDVDNSGTLNAGDVEYPLLSGGNIADLDPNGLTGNPDNVQVLIVADAPNTPNVGDAVNGDIDTYWLRATALPSGGGAAVTETNTGSADDPTVVDIIFGDADGDAGALDDPEDGRHAASGNFTVVTATITVSKSSSVISDPFNLAVNPKAIPGATVQYTIDITNNGSTGAQAIQVVDMIPDNTDFILGSVTSSQAGALTIDYSTTVAPGPPVWGYSPSGAPGSADSAITYIRVGLPSDILSTAGSNTADVQFNVVIE